MEKTTLVIGASPKPARYSYQAVKNLLRKKIPVIAIGSREAAIDNVMIRKDLPGDIGPVHTVTLYLNPTHQKSYYDLILSLKPKRIIFNPGTWNPEFAIMACKKGIKVIDDCMIVMLNCGMY